MESVFLAGVRGGLGQALGVEHVDGVVDQGARQKDAFDANFQSPYVAGLPTLQVDGVQGRGVLGLLLGKLVRVAVVGQEQALHQGRVCVGQGNAGVARRVEQLGQRSACLAVFFRAFWGVGVCWQKVGVGIGTVVGSRAPALAGTGPKSVPRSLCRLSGGECGCGVGRGKYTGPGSAGRNAGVEVDFHTFQRYGNGCTFAVCLPALSKP